VPTDGVSIVTTTWNERESIGRLIAATRDVLKDSKHEIIVVDDDSPDGTARVARKLADKVFKKRREGQSAGLLCGMKLAQYPTIVTIDADLENDPKLIPQLVSAIDNLDILVASRAKLPRISERLASMTVGRRMGVSDVFSNFRAYRKESVLNFELKRGETFGAELLVIAKNKGLRIGEMLYEPSPRRSSPRIGGKIVSNFRIVWALVKSLVYLT
jgi:dolichol-phosphate mannosyltransferase